MRGNTTSLAGNFGIQVTALNELSEVSQLMAVINHNSLPVLHSITVYVDY